MTASSTISLLGDRSLPRIDLFYFETAQLYDGLTMHMICEAHLDIFSRIGFIADSTMICIYIVQLHSFRFGLYI